MKITIEVEEKEIIEMRTLALLDKRFIESRIADLRKQIVDEFATAIKATILCVIKFCYHCLCFSYLSLPKTSGKIS